MLKEIIAWWAARMLECLPERLRHFDITSDSALIVVPAAAPTSPLACTISQLQRGQERPIGRFTLDDSGRSALLALAPSRHRVVRLRVPPFALLERCLVLPLAADRDLARILAYEIDRVTPFRAEEIFWQFAVEQRDRAKGRLTVRLSLVPKAPWQIWLTGLAEAGIAATTIEFADTGPRRRRIDLDRVLSRRERGARRRLVTVAGLYGAMAVAAIVLPFLSQAWAVHEVERRIADLRPAVAQAEVLRQQITSGSIGADVLAAERARTGDVLTALEAVTDALPDDTYLTNLSLRQGHLVLSGQSGAAAKLIGALSEQKLIRNATFDAPITRADQAKLDLFSIRADLAGSAVAGAGPKP